MLHDLLAALEENVMPLHLAVQLEEPGVLEFAWQHDPIADLLDVRYRLGLSPSDQAILVDMVAHVIPCTTVIRTEVPKPNHSCFILDRLHEYLDGTKNFAQLQTEVQEYRMSTNVSNWTHPAEAAYHIAMVISAQNDQEHHHAHGRPALPRLWHLWHAFCLVKDELSMGETDEMIAMLRANLIVPTAREVFATIIHHPTRIVQ
jgi:hypothetical protein